MWTRFLKKHIESGELNYCSQQLGLLRNSLKKTIAQKKECGTWKIIKIKDVNNKIYIN